MLNSISNLSKHFTYDDFSITTSKKENILYIHIINNITSQTYENNINMNTTETPYNNDDTYNILCKCLNTKSNCEFIIKTGYMIFTFSDFNNGLYEIYHYITLTEKKPLNITIKKPIDISQLGSIQYKIYYSPNI